MIEMVLMDEERSRCWIFGKITNVINRKTWSYLGCVKESCTKKAVRYGDKYKCTKCKEVFSKGIHRYMVRVNVKDGTGSTSLYLWDHECRQLLHKTAAQLREILSLKEVYEKAVSKEIDDFVGLHLLFRVDINDEDFTKHEKMYSLRCLTQTSDLIDHFLHKDEHEPEEPHSDSDLDSFFEKPDMTSSNNFATIIDDDDIEADTPSVKRALPIYPDGHDGGSSTQNSTSKVRKIMKSEKP